MTALPNIPAELDPAYVAPHEAIENMRQRQPRVGEWVNCFNAEPNGPGMVRRGLDQYLAQVIEVRDGDYTHGGCLVRPWSRLRQAFEPAFFAPWCCITSRCPVNRYTLTGKWPAPFVGFDA
jgi:hypothetical protein